MVDTVALRAAARSLSTVAAVAEALAAKHGNAASLVSAIGYPRPTMAADSFVSEWTYGAGWIASHATQTGAYLTTTAQTYEAIEGLLAAAASGSGAAPGTTMAAPALPPLYEPVRPALRVTPGMALTPASLATARTVRDLIPGEPDLVATLGRRLVGFADELGDARIALARISLGTWVGASADACAKDLEELSRRVSAAEQAFYAAGAAINAYAPVHVDAQAQAARALALWQAAAPAAAILRGTAVGPMPVGAPADPEADLARAGALFQEARETMAVAAKALAERLEDAQRGAPNDPGLFSKIRRAVESFFVGTVEGTVGVAEGLVVIGGLTYDLNPFREFYDRDGYRKTQNALVDGIGHALTHPGEVGAALIDLETWKEDPAKALGKLFPDIAAIIATGGALGAERGAATTTRLGELFEAVDAGGSPRLAALTAEDIEARVASLGIDLGGPVGEATSAQLRDVWANPDEWLPTTFEPGQQFARSGVDEVGVRVGDSLTYDAGSYFERQQLPGVRSRLSDGSITLPAYDDIVEIFEVRVPMNGATATALANSQFGEGGATLTFIPDLQGAIDRGEVVLVREHLFAPSTLESRFEDPRFRLVDDNLSVHALDPRVERIEGFVEGVREEGSMSARQTGLTAGLAGDSNSIDRGAS
jgi:hypothetical protein